MKTISKRVTGPSVKLRFGLRGLLLRQQLVLSVILKSLAYKADLIISMFTFTRNNSVAVRLFNIEINYVKQAFTAIECVSNSFLSQLMSRHSMRKYQGGRPGLGEADRGPVRPGVRSRHGMKVQRCCNLTGRGQKM